ncbi:pyridoxal phosphate-dependent transferase [Flagelloscypha sp. PMI_526]|nr:pyridoxal phosphate-dependent transferase [Flagelloscypha sp. PMI_526]
MEPFGNSTRVLILLSTIQEFLDLEPLKGVVVADAANIDPVGEEASACPLVHEYSNTCVIQTLSNSFGLAAIHTGIAIAQPSPIQMLTNIKAPYNVSAPGNYLALAAFTPEGHSLMHQKSQGFGSQPSSSNGHLSPPWVSDVTSMRTMPNILLLRILSNEGGEPDSVRTGSVFKKLAEENGVVVMFGGKEHGGEGALRITVGATEETRTFVRQLRKVLGVV